MAQNTTLQKWAFVLAHDLQREYIAPNPLNVKSLFDVSKQHNNSIDVVLILPGAPELESKTNRTFVQKRSESILKEAKHFGMRVLEISPGGMAPPKWLEENKYVNHPLSDNAAKRIRDAGIKIEASTFAAPPGIDQDISELHDPIQDLMKMNAFGLEEYDAAIFYDNDVQLTGRGDVTELFRCASQNVFLSTTGPMDNLNAGFMAFKPSINLLTAVINFAEDNVYDDRTGWAGLGFEPQTQVGPNQQIFYYTLFYRNSPKIQEAFDKAGAIRPRARQLDRCVWNFLNIVGCDPFWDCENVFVLHKDSWNCRKRGPTPIGENQSRLIEHKIKNQSKS